MTSLVVGIVLIVGGIAFAAYPLFRRQSDDTSDASSKGGGIRRTASPQPASDAFAVEREELELDLAMGKLSPADFARLSAALEVRSKRAAHSIAGAAQGVAGVPPDSRVEEADTAPTADANALLEAEAERLVRAERAALVRCTNCGPRPEPGAHFCSTCGRAVGGCPSCGAPIRQDAARFCDQCGTPLGG